MKQRRDLEPNELIDIKKKLDTQEHFLKKTNRKIQIVNNNGSFSEAISEIVNMVNDKICKFNS